MGQIFRSTCQVDLPFVTPFTVENLPVLLFIFRNSKNLTPIFPRNFVSSANKKTTQLVPLVKNPQKFFSTGRTLNADRLWHVSGWLQIGIRMFKHFPKLRTQKRSGIEITNLWRKTQSVSHHWKGFGSTEIATWTQPLSPPLHIGIRKVIHCT